MQQSAKWNGRYGADGYLFGKEPAEFVRKYADKIAPDSSVLVVGDGEGRNSAYLASLGLSVTAMDISEVAVSKARTLAAEIGVTVDYQLGDLLEWEWKPESYDAVVAVFIQFLFADQRADVFNGFISTLRPGGSLLLHGYRPEQIANGTGGPPIEECMYTTDLLAESFSDMHIDVLESYDADLSEGTGHVGPSALIDLVARKK